MTFWGHQPHSDISIRNFPFSMAPKEQEIRIVPSGKARKVDSDVAVPIPPDPKNLALFLDIDGTLVEIVETPDLVRVPHGLPQCLERLSKGLNGALALVTGRTLEDADRIFADLSLPTGAVHGMERRSFDGKVEQTGSKDELADLRDDLVRFAKARPGLMLEDKERTLALHYRAAPEYEDEANAFIRQCLSGRRGISVLHGKMVFEIKPEGVDKGTAIRTFMNEEPFKGRVPVFFGDDTTDEYGFAAIRSLGGFGYRVGQEQHTEAHYRLTDVAAVYAWLYRLILELER